MALMVQLDLFCNKCRDKRIDAYMLNIMCFCVQTVTLMVQLELSRNMSMCRRHVFLAPFLPCMLNIKCSYVQQ